MCERFSFSFKFSNWNIIFASSTVSPPTGRPRNRKRASIFFLFIFWLNIEYSGVMMSTLVVTRRDENYSEMCDRLHRLSGFNRHKKSFWWNNNLVRVEPKLIPISRWITVYIYTCLSVSGCVRAHRFDISENIRRLLELGTMAWKLIALRNLTLESNMEANILSQSKMNF